MIERKAAYEGVEPEALSLQELMYIGLVQGGAVKLEEVVDDREAWTRNLNKLREAWHAARGTVRFGRRNAADFANSTKLLTQRA